MRYVFDEAVLGLSFRKFRELATTRVFCSKVVVTEKKVEAFIKSKKTDISVIDIPLNLEEGDIDIMETANEVVIRTPELVFIVLLNSTSFLEPNESIFEVEWEKL